MPCRRWPRLRRATHPARPPVALVWLVLLCGMFSGPLSGERNVSRPTAPVFLQAADTISPSVPFSIAANYIQGAEDPAAEGFRLYQDAALISTLPPDAVVAGSITFPRFDSGLSAGQYVFGVASIATVSGAMVESSRGTLTLTVGTTPPPPQCSFTFSPSVYNSVPASGGSDGLSLAASAADCVWTSSSSVTWLSLTPPNGTGSMSVTINVQANTGSQRTGVITVGNGTLTVTQAAGGPEPPPPTCTFTVAPTSASITVEGGNGTVTVTASDASCTWTAQSNAAWVTAGGGTTGSGVLSYSVAANTGAQRIGTLTVAGQTVTLTQAAFVPPPPPMPPVAYVLETCDGILTHPGPPDTQSGWGIQFRRHNSDGTFTSIGSRDTTAPYQRRPELLTPGSHTFSGVWTRTGSASVTTPLVTFVCN